MNTRGSQTYYTVHPRDFMLTNSIMMLIIITHDPLRPLDIYFRPFTISICDNNYHTQCSLGHLELCH